MGVLVLNSSIKSTVILMILKKRGTLKNLTWGVAKNEYNQSRLYASSIDVFPFTDLPIGDKRIPIFNFHPYHIKRHAKFLSNFIMIYEPSKYFVVKSLNGDCLMSASIYEGISSSQINVAIENFEPTAILSEDIRHYLTNKQNENRK